MQALKPEGAATSPSFRGCRGFIAAEPGIHLHLDVREEQEWIGLSPQ
jgi:hypothetical protein